MSVSGKKFARNASVMMASQLVTWGLSFVLAIFLPRYLGVSTIGEVSVAYSIWAIVGVLISFGMETHLTKTVARDPEQTAEVLGVSLVLQGIFFLVACVLVGVYLYVFHFSVQTVYIVSIIGISTMLSQIDGILNSVIMGMERMDVTALAGIVNKVLLTALSLLLIFINASIYAVIGVNIVVGIVSLLILATFIVRQHHGLRLRFQLSQAKEMLRLSLPYLVTAFALVGYQQIDNIFIAFLVDTRTVGWYSTATGLFGTVMFIPVIFGTVLFPALSRTYMNANNQFAMIARRSFDLMFLLSVPIGMGIVVVANPIVVLLYGEEFAQSGPVLALLGIVLIFTYLNTMLGYLLISTDNTSKWNLVMIGAIIATLPLDFVLVPWTRDVFGNGALGGALAFLFTEFGMVIGAIFLLPKGTLQWSNVRTSVLSVLAGLIMIAASWWWRDTLMPLSILVGAITYTSLVFLLRIVPRDDLLLLKDAGMQIIGRLRRGKEAPAGLGN